MSIQYCDECDKYINTDYDSEHFNEDGECIESNIIENDFLATFLLNNSNEEIKKGEKCRDED